MIPTTAQTPDSTYHIEPIKVYAPKPLKKTAYRKSLVATIPVYQNGRLVIVSWFTFKLTKGKEDMMFERAQDREKKQ